MAIEPVVIRFAAAGVPEVSAAFQRVGAQLRRFEEQATRERQRGARVREEASRKETRGIERETAKLQKDMAKAERQRTRDAEREAKRREDIVRRSSELAGREAAKAAKAEEREARRVAREIERIEERKMRVRIRSSELAGRAAARAAAEEARAAERASRARGAVGRRIGGIVSSSVGATLSGMGSMAFATMGIAGGFGLANAAREQLSAERSAALLVNAGTNGGVAPGTVGRALGAASQVSTATGMSKDVLLGAALKYSQNARGGDFEGALGNMGFLARMSTVTGADINDLAEAAGTLQSQNPDQFSGKDGSARMQKLLLNTLAQSHQGSMSLVDAAKQFGILGATRAYYKGDVAGNQQTLIGLGQIARAGGDVGEAGTFIKDLATESTIANRKFRKKHGRDLLHIDEKTGQLDSPEALVEQVFRATNGNIAEIGESFGQRGSRLFGELAQSYRKAGGGEAGIEAVKKNMREVTGATMTPEEMEKQFQQAQSTPAAKFQLALTKMSEVLQEKLEPRMEHFADETLPKLIPKFEAIVDAATKFADWFADNPIKGVGAVVLAAVTKDLAAAGIGAAVKASLTAILSGTGLGKATGDKVASEAAGGGALKAIGGAGVVAAMGIASTAGIMNITSGLALGKEDGAAIAKAAREGRISPQRLAEIQAQAQQTIKETSGGKAIAKGILESTGVDPLARAVGLAKPGESILGGPDAGTLAKQQAAAVELTKQLNDASAALRNFSASVGAIPPVQSGAPTVPIPQRPVH